jgi:hypothetical protein
MSNDTPVVDDSPAGIIQVPEQLNDPLGYYKAQAEKFARLLAKTEQGMNESISKKDEEISALSSRLAEIESGLNAEKAARFDEWKMRLMTENGLDQDLIEFVSGSDEETVKAQIQKLVEKTKQSVKPQSPRLGNGITKTEKGKPSFLGESGRLPGGGYIINN